MQTSMANRAVPGIKNSGAAWSPEEEERLIAGLKEGTPVAALATIHQRTIGGITSRQNVIAQRMIQVGSPIEEVQAETCLSLDSVVALVKKFKAPPEEKKTAAQMSKEVTDALQRLLAGQTAISGTQKVVLDILKSMRALAENKAAAPIVNAKKLPPPVPPAKKSAAPKLPEAPAATSAPSESSLGSRGSRGEILEAFKTLTDGEIDTLFTMLSMGMSRTSKTAALSMHAIENSIPAEECIALLNSAAMEYVQAPAPELPTFVSEASAGRCVDENMPSVVPKVETAIVSAEPQAPGTISQLPADEDVATLL